MKDQYKIPEPVYKIPPKKEESALSEAAKDLAEDKLLELSSLGFLSPIIKVAEAIQESDGDKSSPKGHNDTGRTTSGKPTSYYVSPGKKNDRKKDKKKKPSV